MLLITKPRIGCEALSLPAGPLEINPLVGFRRCSHAI